MLNGNPSVPTLRAAAVTRYGARRLRLELSPASPRHRNAECLCLLTRVANHAVALPPSQMPTTSRLVQGTGDVVGRNQASAVSAAQMETGRQQMTPADDAAAADDPLAEEIPKETICFDFTKGKCNRSAAVCKFSHDPEVIARVNSREKGVCYDWQYGACARGKLCRFSHSPQNLEEQQARQALKQQVTSKT